MTPADRFASRRRGAVLVLVVLLTALLSAVVYELAFRGAVDGIRSTAAAERTAARHAVRSLLACLRLRDFPAAAAAAGGLPTEAVDGRKPSLTLVEGTTTIRIWCDRAGRPASVNDLLRRGGSAALQSAIRDAAALSHRQFPAVRDDLPAEVHALEGLFAEPVPPPALYGPTERGDHLAAAFTAAPSGGVPLLMEARTGRTRLWICASVTEERNGLRPLYWREIEGMEEARP